MSDNTLLLATTLKPSRLQLEPLNGVEGPPRLERADPLQVLALEPEPQNGLRGLAPLPLRPSQVARRRCQLRQRPVGEHGRPVDVGFDDLVGCHHRVTGEGERRRQISHVF